MVSIDFSFIVSDVIMFSSTCTARFVDVDITNPMKSFSSISFLISVPKLVSSRF